MSGIIVCSGQAASAWLERMNGAATAALSRPTAVRRLNFIGER
jgi:hypothetical protein